MQTMTSSTVAQSEQLCSPIKATIVVCQGLRVGIHVPPDVPLMEFWSDSDWQLMQPIGSHNAFLFVDAVHSRVMYWEFHSSESASMSRKNSASSLQVEPLAE